MWVSETRAARSAGMDLDHAVEAVRQRTLSRYLAFADDAPASPQAVPSRIVGVVGAAVSRVAGAVVSH